MKRPESVWPVLGLIFCGLGAVYLAMAALSPTDGRGWLGWACALLLAGLACLLAEGGRRARRDRLRALGTPVSGRVESAARCRYLTFKTKERLGSPTVRSSPWKARCRYRWQGRDYLVSSCLLWDEPLSGASVTVYLDPRRPRRAWPDPDTIPQRRSL